jgi:hypothetical protein
LLFLRRWWVVTFNLMAAVGLLVVQIMFVPFLPIWVIFLAFAITGLVTCCSTGCGCDPDQHHGHHHHHEHQAPVVQYQYVPPAGAPTYQQAYQNVAPHPAGPPPAYGSSGAPPPAYASAPAMSEWAK